MTTIPITIVDNFLENPNIIRDWALTLEYKSDSDLKWPGKRTQLLHNIHPFLYNYISSKVLALFFENVYNLSFDIDLSFQLIENYTDKGWIHQDPDIFTFIIYLHESNPLIDCGTSIWSLNSNNLYPFNNYEDRNLYVKYSKSHNDSKTLFSKYQEDFEKRYTKEISIPDKYNRLIAFSSEHFHSANYYDNEISSRLTLIGFVKQLGAANTPIIRSKKITMY